MSLGMWIFLGLIACGLCGVLVQWYLIDRRSQKDADKNKNAQTDNTDTVTVDPADGGYKDQHRRSQKDADKNKNAQTDNTDTVDHADGGDPADGGYEDRILNLLRSDEDGGGSTGGSPNYGTDSIFDILRIRRFIVKVILVCIGIILAIINAILGSGGGGGGGGGGGVPIGGFIGSIFKGFGGSSGGSTGGGSKDDISK